jgi:hypothetical protein
MTRGLRDGPVQKGLLASLIKPSVRRNWRTIEIICNQRTGNGYRNN